QVFGAGGRVRAVGRGTPRWGVRVRGPARRARGGRRHQDHRGGGGSGGDSGLSLGRPVGQGLPSSWGRWWSMRGEFDIVPLHGPVGPLRREAVPADMYLPARSSPVLHRGGGP